MNIPFLGLAASRPRFRDSAAPPAIDLFLLTAYCGRLGALEEIFFSNNIHDLASPQTIFESISVGKPIGITPIRSKPP